MKKFFTSFALVAAVATLAPVAGFADGPIAKKGDIIGGKLQESLSSKTNHDGDKFEMTEQDTFFHKNAALHGATIEGHVENVTPAGPTHKATMNVFFDDVKMADGSTVPLAAKVQKIDPPTHHIRDVGLIIGGAVAGHMVGSKSGHKHGGLAGAAAGFALASTMKSDISVKNGSVVKLQLTQDLTPGAAAASSM